MGSNRLLPFEVVQRGDGPELTGLAGLVPFADMACALGLPEMIDRCVGTGGSQGWRDRDHILALLLLNLAGGDSVEDIEHLEKDAGACRVFEALKEWGLSRRERRELARRFRRGRERSFPSVTRIREYLETYHDEVEEAKRKPGHAFIPARTAKLCALLEVGRRLIAAIMACRPERQATVDIDGTLVETTKQEALYCYEGYRAYQPVTAFWHETGLVVLSEFRDGNVPAGHDTLRVLQETMKALPACVEKVRVRMDTAGYQHDVLSWMASLGGGDGPAVEFTVSCDVTPAFREEVRKVPEAEWEEVPSSHGEPSCQCAEVVFVPMPVALAKHEPHRYIAIREPVRRPVLPGLEEAAGELGYTPVVMADRTYRVRGIVTNMTEDAASVVRFHYGRCGKGEEIHSILKSDFAGGVLPSRRFGADAAWWEPAVLAYNLLVAMRRLAFPRAWRNRRMKALRLALISLPAVIVRHARSVAFQVAGGRRGVLDIVRIRSRIAGFSLAPT